MKFERRWQVSQHRITRVPDTVLVVHLGANFRVIFEWTYLSRRKEFEKVLMKNIEMVKESPKITLCSKFSKTRAACHGYNV
jgi:hypothetical protein